MAATSPPIPSIVPEAKPEPPDAFLARWSPPAAWYVKAPWSGWTKAPGTWTEHEPVSAVRRAFGLASTKAARVVVVESGHDTRAQEGRTK
jgi:hypothetical protein